jgi:hypothetical protein
MRNCYNKQLGIFEQSHQQELLVFHKMLGYYFIHFEAFGKQLQSRDNAASALYLKQLVARLLSGYDRLF